MVHRDCRSSNLYIRERPAEMRTLELNTADIQMTDLDWSGLAGDDRYLGLAQPNAGSLPVTANRCAVRCCDGAGARCQHVFGRFHFVGQGSDDV